MAAADVHRYFHRLLSDIDYAHKYEEHPGGHSWDCWDLHIQAGLEFHKRHLKIPS